MQSINDWSIGWYMLLEHQVIWCQGEAAGPNHGARKAYTNRLSTWFAPKILHFLYHPYLVTIIW